MVRMAGLALGRLVWLAFAAITADVAAMPAQAAPGQDAATLEPSTIETATLETGSSNGISIRLAEDLASVVDGTARRILPVVGPGGVPAIADLLQTPGIDMAIVQLDVLDDARTRRLVAGIENLSYIAKLNYVEFHLLARQEIGSVAELTGKTVSVGQPLGNTAITASQLFKLLNLPVTLTNDAPDVAIERLQRGDIGAVALVSGKPSPLLRVLPTQGLHLLSIPLTPGVIGTYVPTRLTVADYPGLVPPHSAVDTVAVGTGLFVGPLAADSDTYRKIANVVDAFFIRFQTLLTPGHHPKWSEVNLSSEIPGWHRFPPAEDWLKRNVAAVAGQDLRSIFVHFLDQREKAIGGPPMSEEQKDALFSQFRQWQSSQVAAPALQGMQPQGAPSGMTQTQSVAVH
jgi:TRAP-type uncharacterized transport system substrate-binding protein